MKNKPMSTTLSNRTDKSLSKWDEAISEAKTRILGLKRSIRTLEDLRDSGMPFPAPETYESEPGLLGQK